MSDECSAPRHETSLRLVVRGADFDPDAVTQALGVEPSRCSRKGDVISPRFPTRCYRQSLWVLESDLPPTADLEEHLAAILRRVGPRTEAFRVAVGDAEVELLGAIDAAGPSATIELTPVQCAAVASLGAKLNVEWRRYSDEEATADLEDFFSAVAHPPAAVRLGRARLSLDGLSIGDAFGERLFRAELGAIERRETPPGPWFYTDDTVMAMSIVDVLAECGGIDQDKLARLFAARYMKRPNRAYGGGAAQLLSAIDAGADWRIAARRLFDGQGSMGNGGAMRVGPVGGYFADDLSAAIEHARASAEVTHAHTDGQAGAIAVAVAAATACRIGPANALDGQEVLQAAVEHTPDGPTREGLRLALALGPDETPVIAAHRLGSGQRVLSSDTVPFALWCAARSLASYEDALWTTAAGLGDIDTTCAIVGSIVSLAVGREGLPADWLRCREPLED